MITPVLCGDPKLIVLTPDDTPPSPSHSAPKYHPQYSQLSVELAVVVVGVKSADAVPTRQGNLKVASAVMALS